MPSLACECVCVCGGGLDPLSLAGPPHRLVLHIHGLQSRELSCASVSLPHIRQVSCLCVCVSGSASASASACTSPPIFRQFYSFIHFSHFFSLRPTNRCHPCPSKAVTCDAQPLVCAAVCAYVYVYLCAFVRAAMSEWVSE